MSRCVPGRGGAGWAEDDAAWRDPEEVLAGLRRARALERGLLDGRVSGDWWAVLERLDACLVVSREYEHLLLALTVTPEGPRESFMSIPHPSGMAFDPIAQRLHVASTRNPNQLYVLAPGCPGEADGRPGRDEPRSLVALSSSFFPGRLYLHDLALIGGVLHGSAVGLNAIVRLTGPGAYEPAWWPRAIERGGHPDMTRNYLQLNSIAAGERLSSSFFTASTDRPSFRRPGHRNFPVDRRGVVFSGETREPLIGGLTRPHSARLHQGELWVDDSGYGRLAVVREERLTTVARLPGWTRGLTFAGEVAFVGTSRVIPRFAHYAPGLDVGASMCAVHALDVRSGQVLGSIHWPAGNQIFDIAVLPRSVTLGFAALAKRRQGPRELRSFFFSYHVPDLPGAT
jgi:uncharacterized protein (TIGR03032 family)